MWSMFVTAFAADNLCLDTTCAEREEALSIALAEEGVDDPAWLAVEEGADGMTWLTVAAVDKAALDGLCPKADALTVQVGEVYERTVPLWLFNSEAGAFREPGRVIHTDMKGGASSSAQEGAVVCVGTEQGLECWTETLPTAAFYP